MTHIQFWGLSTQPPDQGQTDVQFVAINCYEPFKDAIREVRPLATASNLIFSKLNV